LCVNINEEIEKKCIAVQEKKERDIKSKFEEKINKEKSKVKQIQLFILIIAGGILAWIVRDWLRFGRLF
jgi:16S rRNA U1498 N3-methylase RsmE